jgi:hypothetical protein
MYTKFWGYPTHYPNTLNQLFVCKRTLWQCSTFVLLPMCYCIVVRPAIV